MKPFGNADRLRLVPIFVFAILGGFFTIGGYNAALSGQRPFGTALIAVSASLWALAILLLDNRASDEKLKERFADLSSRLAKIEGSVGIDYKVSNLAGKIDSTTSALTEVRTELKKIVESKTDARLDDMERAVNVVSKGLVDLDGQTRSNTAALEGVGSTLDSTMAHLTEIRADLKRISESRDELQDKDPNAASG